MTDLTIVSSSPLGSGGLGRVTYNWARGFADRGRDVRVLCSAVDGVDASGFETVTRSPGLFSYYWRDLYYSAKTRLLDDLPGEVLAWHGLGTFLDADHVHVGSVAKPLQDDRLAAVGLNTDDFDFRKRVDDAFFSAYNYHRRVVADAPHVIAPSPDVRESLALYDDDAPAKTTVVPHGVAESFVQRGGPGRDQVLFVGGTMLRKGISTLLSAWADYNGPEKLLVAGYGDAESFGLLRADHGVAPDRAEYLGFVDEDRLLKMYRESKALVLPSFEEGFGIPVLEALAAGTPVICSDAVGSRFVVEECDAGEVVPAGDPDALRTALTDLLDDDEKRTSRGAAGRELVANDYLWRHVVADLDHAVFGGD